MTQKTIDPHISQAILGMQINGTSGLMQVQLSRPDYKKAEEVIRAHGGVWSTKKRRFEFDNPEDVELLMRAAESGRFRNEREEEKKLMQFFPTPERVVRDMLSWGDVREGMRVLEPSAGDGAIARNLVQLGADVTMVELSSARFQLLVSSFGNNQVIMADFLTLQPEQLGRFDRVIMNPPFANGQDVTHVTHALKFLQPGGILVSVMSPGFTFRNGTLYAGFRRLVEEKQAEVHPLPESSFRSSGTDINTMLVKFTQP